jgi:hypothetical protein
MKLEFLSVGSSDGPLIRLYDFDAVGAQRLREAFRCLSARSRETLPLHEEWWVEPVDGCALTLRLGIRDLGVVERLPSRFECVLTAQTWAKLVSRVGPFCDSASDKAYHWLNQDGEISLLLSPRGTW